MVTCKALPIILDKGAWHAGQLDVPGLKNKLEAWRQYLRITPGKFTPDKLAQEILEKRQQLAQEILASFGAVKKYSPHAILSSPCFHKDSDTIQELQEDLLESLTLTARGSQWLTAAKLEKMAVLF